MKFVTKLAFFALLGLGFNAFSMGENLFEGALKQVKAHLGTLNKDLSELDDISNKLKDKDVDTNAQLLRLTGIITGVLQHQKQQIDESLKQFEVLKKNVESFKESFGPKKLDKKKRVS